MTKKTTKLTIRQLFYKHGVMNEFLIKTLERTWKEERKFIKEWKEIDKINKLIN